MEKEKILEAIDWQSRVLVGMLCKRVECLQKEKVLTPELYKSLAKELIYESSRNLKKIIDIYFGVGKVVFKCKDRPKE